MNFIFSETSQIKELPFIVIAYLLYILIKIVILIMLLIYDCWCLGHLFFSEYFRIAISLRTPKILEGYIDSISLKLAQ